MHEDFTWLRAIFKSPKNKSRHYLALYNLYRLFEKKWIHYKYDPLHGKNYTLYVTYLKIVLKHRFE
jgi:hypothetical protein